MTRSFLQAPHFGGLLLFLRFPPASFRLPTTAFQEKGFLSRKTDELGLPKPERFERARRTDRW